MARQSRPSLLLDRPGRQRRDGAAYGAQSGAVKEGVPRMSGLRSFYINPETRDIEFDELGRLRMVESDTDLTAERQRLRLRLGTHTREWFLDVLLGAPWLELVEKGVPQERIRAEVLRAIQRDEQVERVESL